MTLKNGAREMDEKEQYQEAINNYMHGIEYLLLARKCTTSQNEYSISYNV